MKAESVVLDTNILISAALQAKGPSRAVLNWVRQADAALIFSLETLEELRSRLLRPKFDKYLTAEIRHTYLAQIEAVAEIVGISGAKMGCRDGDDDKVLETALMGNADVIVTRDADLLVMVPFQGVEVLTAQGFLAMVGGAPIFEQGKHSE